MSKHHESQKNSLGKSESQGEVDITSPLLVNDRLQLWPFGTNARELERTGKLATHAQRKEINQFRQTYLNR